jgi:hypothetical protein
MPAQRGAFDTTINYLKRTLDHAGPFIEEWNRVPQLNTDAAVDANLDWEMTGTGAASLTAATHSTGGGIKMLTNGTDDRQVILSPHLDTQQSSLNAVDFEVEDGPYMGVKVETADSVAAIKIHIGLVIAVDSFDEGTDANQLRFTFDTDTSDANWKANWSIGGDDTEKDTGVAVSANTAYMLRIAVDDDRKGHFYINDKLEASTTAIKDVGVTDINLIPFIAIQALATGAATLYCRKVIVGKRRQTN